MCWLIAAPKEVINTNFFKQIPKCSKYLFEVFEVQFYDQV